MFQEHYAKLPISSRISKRHSPIPSIVVFRGRCTMLLNRAATKMSGLRGGDRVVMLLDEKRSILAFQKTDSENGFAVYENTAGLRMTCGRFLRVVVKAKAGTYGVDMLKHGDVRVPGFKFTT